jgi:hypothetical protein
VGLPRAVTVLVAAGAATALCGCAAWLDGPLAGLRRAPGALGGGLEPPIPCAVGPYPSRGMQGEDTMVIGSVRFGGLGFRYGPDRFVAGAPPLTVPIEVPPHLRVVIEVPPDRRRTVGIDNAPVPARTPGLAHRAMRCPDRPATGFYTVTFVVDGPQCVPLSVTHRYGTQTRVIPFGVRRCPPPGPPGP